MFLRGVEGDYFPSFFLIQIMSNETVSEININDTATFVHEYLHFMQDIIFPYCIRMNLSYFRWFDNIRFYGKENKQIKRPFNDWNDDCSILDMQFKQTFGSLKAPKDELKIKRRENSKETFTGFDSGYAMKERTIDVYKYELVFENESRYQVGARDLLEYLAYKIETKHYGGNSEIPKYPYKTIDCLFEKYGYSDLDPAKKIFIAEYCMYNDNPVRYLFNIFLEDENRMKSMHEYDINDLFDDYLNVVNVSKDGVSETFSNKVDRRLNDFLDELKELYHHSDKLCKWIEHINTYVREHFLNRFIFTKLFVMNDEDFKKYMGKLYSELKYPLILNKEEKMININNEDHDFEYLYILESFINFIREGKQSRKCCPIDKFCKANYDIKCNGKYDVQNICNENCPYKKFLNLNGLSDVVITN